MKKILRIEINHKEFNKEILRTAFTENITAMYDGKFWWCGDNPSYLSSWHCKEENLFMHVDHRFWAVMSTGSVVNIPKNTPSTACKLL